MCPVCGGGLSVMTMEVAGGLISGGFNWLVGRRWVGGAGVTISVTLCLSRLAQYSLISNQQKLPSKFVGGPV